MKLLTILGARPQFIKAAAVSREIAKYDNLQEVIIHTGQHFDKNMSDIFFDEMQIPKPDYMLNINSTTHGAMTGRMIEEIEKIIIDEKPAAVIVYGDTNTTLASAIATKKLHVKLVHIEAGLRSFNMKMPEEINRILTDRISDILFCPTETAIKNLTKEGFQNFKTKIILAGDVMYDTAIYYKKFAKKGKIKLPEKYILATIHRAENTDDINRLKNIIKTFKEIAEETTIVLPMHPRTKKIIENNNLLKNINKNKFIIVEPVGYLESIYLIENSSLVMTDSGGMQKEAYFFNKYCVTLRDETEWTELVENGFNEIVGAETKKIKDAYNKLINKKFKTNIKLYGEGNAAEIIIKELLSKEDL